MAAPSARTLKLAKVVLFLLCLLPLGKLFAEIFGIAGLSLGANPIEELLHRLGWWGLTFLMITLAVSPLRRLSGQGWLLRFRRMLGLYAFAYISLHFLTYSLLDQRLDFGAIGEDILERPYITLGISGLILLIPLALTSTNRWQRRLGRRWRTLHRLVYPIGILGVWHFWWQVKQDVREPLVYAAILALLLGERLVFTIRTRRAAAARAATVSGQ